MPIDDDRIWNKPEFARGPTVGEIWDRERRQQEAERAEMIENARADANAVWLLADYMMPADVRDAAERWKMKEALSEIWRGAFIAGWRAAHRGK